MRIAMIIITRTEPGLSGQLQAAVEDSSLKSWKDNGMKGERVVRIKQRSARRRRPKKIQDFETLAVWGSGSLPLDSLWPQGNF